MKQRTTTVPVYSTLEGVPVVGALYRMKPNKITTFSEPFLQGMERKYLQITRSTGLWMPISQYESIGDSFLVRYRMKILLGTTVWWHEAYHDEPPPLFMHEYTERVL